MLLHPHLTSPRGSYGFGLRAQSLPSSHHPRGLFDCRIAPSSRSGASVRYPSVEADSPPLPVHRVPAPAGSGPVPDPSRRLVGKLERGLLLPLFPGRDSTGKAGAGSFVLVRSLVLPGACSSAPSRGVLRRPFSPEESRTSRRSPRSSPPAPPSHATAGERPWTTSGALGSPSDPPGAGGAPRWRMSSATEKGYGTASRPIALLSRTELHCSSGDRGGPGGECSRLRRVGEIAIRFDILLALSPSPRRPGFASGVPTRQSGRSGRAPCAPHGPAGRWATIVSRRGVLSSSSAPPRSCPSPPPLPSSAGRRRLLRSSARQCARVRPTG